MRYKKVLKIFLPFVVMLSCGISNVMAQARYFGEFGILGGGSFYNGDANTSKVFLEPHLAFGGLLRINLTNRGALKINIIRGAVSGDSRNMDNALPGGVQVEFERDFWDVGFHFEHNFFKYGFCDKPSAYEVQQAAFIFTPRGEILPSCFLKSFAESNANVRLSLRRSTLRVKIKFFIPR
jgi:hypothetical protein